MAEYINEKAARLAVLRTKAEPKSDAIAKINFKPASEVAEKIAVIFDDSGSMGTEDIKNAKLGTIEFLRNIQPNSAAVGVFPLSIKDGWNTNPARATDGTLTTLGKINQELSTYRTDLTELAKHVDSPELKSRGGTPLYQLIHDILLRDITPSRMIAFSDGVPNWVEDKFKELIFSLCQEKKIPIDTVLIGSAGSSGHKELQHIAEETGGIFMIFDPSKVNFRTAFKYLAPVNRKMLTDPAFKASVERGEQK